MRRGRQPCSLRHQTLSPDPGPARKLQNVASRPCLRKRLLDGRDLAEPQAAMGIPMVVTTLPKKPFVVLGRSGAVVRELFGQDPVFLIIIIHRWSSGLPNCARSAAGRRATRAGGPLERNVGSRSPLLIGMRDPPPYDGGRPS